MDDMFNADEQIAFKPEMYAGFANKRNAVGKSDRANYCGSVPMGNCGVGSYEREYMAQNSKPQMTEMNQDTEINSSHKARGMLSCMVN